MSKSRKAHHGEGSVFKLSDPTRTKPWVAQVTLENGRKKQTYHATQREASASKRKMLHELEHGQLVTSAPQTVEAYMRQWLQAKRLEISDGTFQWYRQYTERFILPYIGHIRLQKLTDAHIQDMYAKLPERLSPTTKHMVHTVLSGALNAAVKSHKITASPCKLVTAPRVATPELAYLTLEQARAFLAVLPDHKYEAILTLALSSGMRQGELLALHWSDIDFEKGTVHVARSLACRNPDGTGYEYKEKEPKTPSSRRTIPIPDFAMDALQRHRVRQLEQRLAASQWEEHGLVFPNGHGKYLSVKTMSFQFKKLLEKAGLPSIRFHDLRHSAATILLAMGVNPKVVQERLGHSNISITLGVYGHVSEGMQQEATNKLNEQFKKGKQVNDE